MVTVSHLRAGFGGMPVSCHASKQASSPGCMAVWCLCCQCSGDMIFEQLKIIGIEQLSFFHNITLTTLESILGSTPWLFLYLKVVASVVQLPVHFWQQRALVKVNEGGCRTPVNRTPCCPPLTSQAAFPSALIMSEEDVDSHVLRKYSLVQKLGKGVSLSAAEKISLST